ncbi:mRNA-binding ribosome synthesis protein [Entomophthora muscae]|uniref:mRNA-binding ribosome synthesis protein n=1 Tax=Entomophthora muscae TaxID=34485 RepID=A0ACC2TWG5_9FUNG|nr:mRNA-binding ribosome synthesis protein [Entomophthora muscae]
MGRIKKKGESGIAVKYITRNKAVKKLQISLFDFRRLSFYKKIKRALAKKQTEYAKDLKSRAPKYTLDHLVKERYPSFVDALRDLDDALSMVFLLATMPPAGKMSCFSCGRMPAT